ncbi:uncharacterized protein LOC143294531 [Babylonia areolata]|uniref:uncharacterized protein LOC143294531 n=1 Tax=Babylonia areolata TaxID=304850 RepID=UPI003FD31458
MALKLVRHFITVTVQNFVPLVRLGARPLRWTIGFLLEPVRVWFASSAPVPSLVGSSVHFAHPEAMELQGRIVVYSILGCPHCMRAKNTLMELGLPYQDVRLDLYPKEVREQVKARTGKSTVPQIYFNAHHIGGNDDLQKLVNEDKVRLDRLIEELKTTAPPKDAPVPPDPSTSLESEDTSSEFVCEPDEYSQLVEELKKSGLVKDHRQGLKTYKKTFCGKDFVDWVVRTKGLDRETAVEMGQNLIDSHFGHHVKADEEFQDAEVYYRLLEDTETGALNGDTISQCEPGKATQVGEDLRKLILKLYSAFLSPDGKRVDYKGIANSDEFRRYVQLARELQRVNLQECGREDKLAFFVNIYNALVIHANIVRGPPVNLWQRYKFFNTVKYIIGGYEYSLQDIENGVLRANRKGVGMLTRPFSKSDPRLSVALETHEPLIHFGLVCGAKSCPPIKTYTPDEVVKQLSLAAEAFLDGSDGCEVDVAKKTVHLSMILKWYQQDFGRNDVETVYWVFKHMQNGDKKRQLGQLLDGKKYKVSYMKYDWSVNSK